MRQKRTIAAAALLTMLAAPGMAQSPQSDTDRVATTVRDYMAAFDDQNAEAMAALQIEGAHLVMVREGQGTARTATRSLPMSESSQSIANSPRDLAEPITITAVMVEGPVAMVWADYSLFVDGKKHHYGIDIFTLARVDGEWKIATITYSHIDEPCENAPDL